MNFRLILLMIIAILFMSQKFGDSYKIEFSITRHHESSPIEESYYFTCVCNGQTRGAKLYKNNMNKIFQSVQNRNFCEEDESYYCEWLRECEKCIGYINECTALHSPGSGYNCARKSFVMQETNDINSKARNGSFGVLRRKPRQSSACFYPPMQTSDLIFVEYPNSIYVKQKCIFGYTLDEGITREMRCAYAENEWKPRGFEECHPFLDCTIELMSTGHLECLTANTEKAPQCNITCDRYEDKPGEPKRAYECQIEGGWKPKLPFCAAPIRGGIVLVPAPKIRSHPKTKANSDTKEATKGDSEYKMTEMQKSMKKKLPNIKRLKQSSPMV